MRKKNPSYLTLLNSRQLTAISSRRRSTSCGRGAGEHTRRQEKGWGRAREREMGKTFFSVTQEEWQQKSFTSWRSGNGKRPVPVPTGVSPCGLITMSPLKPGTLSSEPCAPTSTKLNIWSINKMLPHRTQLLNPFLRKPWLLKGERNPNREPILEVRWGRTQVDKKSGSCANWKIDGWFPGSFSQHAAGQDTISLL